MPPDPVKSSGTETLLTRTVPVEVPSLFQRSEAFTPSKAVKYRVPNKEVRNEGPEPPLGLISLMREVPASEPSLLHNSEPCVPSSAAKKRVPLKSTRFW